MNQEIKFSIIVPVYKVEMYLNRCISSIVRQTYKNIEIILIDDGSPDKCPHICDKWREIDDRIKVIHKKNGGLSDARNTGILEASGEYILFVDSDDYIEIDTCEKFYISGINQTPDIIVGNAKRIEKNNISLISHSSKGMRKQIYTGKDYLKIELKENTMHMAAWLNLYNRKFLLDNKLKFQVGLLHEDEEFTPRVFLKAEKIIGTHIFFYNYVIRDDSITTSKNKIKNASHIIKTCKQLEKIYNQESDEELRKLLNNNLVDKFLNTFQVAQLNKRKYSYLIDKTFLKNKAYTKRNKFRVKLFIISKNLYYYTNVISKIMKRNR